MAFSYTGNPATSLLDQVRFLTQDTNEPGQHTDEEIEWLLGESSGSPYDAAYQACLALAMKYVGKAGSRSIGDVSITYADLTKRYTDLAVNLRARAGRSSTPVPYLGGLSQADKTANDADGDHVPRGFSDDTDWSNNNPVAG